MLIFYIAEGELNCVRVISEQAMLFSGWVFIVKIISVYKRRINKANVIAVKYRFLRLLGKMCAN